MNRCKPVVNSVDTLHRKLKCTIMQIEKALINDSLCV